MTNSCDINLTPIFAFRTRMSDNESRHKNSVHPKQDSYVKNPLPHLFLDGVASLGKTSLLTSLVEQQFNCKFCDFAENIARYPEFKFKHSSPILANLYTIYHFKMLENEPPSIVDRSCLSDIWYTGVFGLSNNTVSVLELSNIFDSQIFRMLSKDFKTLFFTVNIEDKQAISDITNAMIKRKNNLDIMSDVYVRTQITVFNILKAKNIPNFHFWEKPMHIRMYSPEYVSMMEAAVKLVLDTVQPSL